MIFSTMYTLNHLIFANQFWSKDFFSKITFLINFSALLKTRNLSIFVISKSIQFSIIFFMNSRQIGLSKKKREKKFYSNQIRSNYVYCKMKTFFFKKIVKKNFFFLYTKELFNKLSLFLFCDEGLFLFFLRVDENRDNDNQITNKNLDSFERL